jgi:uncharacterized repeat protein (TIGR03806 family)
MDKIKRSHSQPSAFKRRCDARAKLLLLCVMLVACGLPAGTDVGEPVSQRPDIGLRPGELMPGGWLPQDRTQRCQLPPAPPLGNMELEPVLGPEFVERVLWVGAVPANDGQLWALEQGGKVIEVTGNQSPRTILDLRVSRTGNEEGLLGLAVHPNFKQTGHVYIYYSAAQPRRSVLSRFTYDNATQVVDITSQVEMMTIEQPFGNHNGGDIHFGPDGYLYVSLGDGGGAGDPYGHGQDTTSLLGSVLRIDVDAEDPNCMKAYSIPADNPFAQSGCGNELDTDRPEIWAWGLRNVWRMSFDVATGILWGGDVGQDRKEEISLIEGGLNYGWNPVEADICYQSGCMTTAFAPPIHTYTHDEGESVTGGLVYRDNDLPELWGQYVFGDYESGRIWALNDAGTAQLLAESRRKISSFGIGTNGELLVASFNGGIERLVRANPDPNLPIFPTRLSDTGCTSLTAEDAQAANLLPYFVNYPFWSDGVSKSRYVALPPSGEIVFEDAKPPTFPVGTVIVKNFYIQGSSARPFPIETRLIHREANYWSAFTYQWNPEGTDASLVTAPTQVTLNHQGQSFNWQLMDRTQCDKCHIQEQGYALGLSLNQLSRMVDYPDGEREQVRAWIDAGYASQSGSAPPPFPMPLDQPGDAELEQQVRVYLHVNCASCHQPDGPGDAEIDLRLDTPFSEMGLCNVRTDRDLVDTTDGYLLKPGVPDESILYLRLNRRDEQQMPPLGSNQIDRNGASIVQAWILSLTECNTPTL